MYFNFPKTHITDYRCNYCYRDFHRSQNLYNHINKTKCKDKHKPYTNANFWARNKRTIKCTQPGCNGTYSTKRSLEMHLATNHGLQKSKPDVKRQGLGAVCNNPPKKKQKTGKLLKKVQYFYCLKPNLHSLFIQDQKKQRNLRHQAVQAVLQNQKKNQPLHNQEKVRKKYSSF